MKFKIEKYNITVKQRSWGSCQENDQSEDAYYDTTEERWRVLLNGKEIANDIPYEGWAKAYVSNWKDTDLSGRVAFQQLEIKKILKEVEKTLKSDLKEWAKLQKKRISLINAGKAIPKQLYSLSSKLNKFDKVINALNDKEK